MDTVTCEKCGEEDRAEDGFQVPLGHSPLLPVLKGIVLNLPTPSFLLYGCIPDWDLGSHWMDHSWLLNPADSGLIHFTDLSSSASMSLKTLNPDSLFFWSRWFVLHFIMVNLRCWWKESWALNLEPSCGVWLFHSELYRQLYSAYFLCASVSSPRASQHLHQIRLWRIKARLKRDDTVKYFDLSEGKVLCNCTFYYITVLLIISSCCKDCCIVFYSLWGDHAQYLIYLYSHLTFSQTCSLLKLTFRPWWIILNSAQDLKPTIHNERQELDF